MAQLFFISDIHGRVDLLKEIIEYNIDFDCPQTHLYTLGDYVDGNPYNKNTNSFLTLNYLFELQSKYPNQVTCLLGNHDCWLGYYLSPKKFPLLSTTLRPSIETLQDFITEEEFMAVYTEANSKERSQVEFVNFVYDKLRAVIGKKHAALIDRLAQLPYFAETKDFIAVHAGVVEIENCYEAWKTVSDENTFLMKYPVEKSLFYKPLITGHIGTHEIACNPDFHDIYCYGNHIFLDSTIIKSGYLNLLKYDTETKVFTSIKKEGYQWIEYRIVDALNS